MRAKRKQAYRCHTNKPEGNEGDQEKSRVRGRSTKRSKFLRPKLDNSGAAKLVKTHD